MAGNRQYGSSPRRSSGSSDSRKMIFMAMTGVVIILLLLIFIVQVNRRKAAEAARAAEESSLEESRSLAEAQSLAEASREAAEAQIERSVRPCEDPAILEMVQQYFDARLAADTETLGRIFGRTEPGAQDEELKGQLQAQASWIRSFDDVEVYLLNGREENARIGIVKYRINFRRVNAKAPCITYFYAVQDEDGTWHMRENLLKETREFIDQKFAEAGVDRMIEEQTAELRALLSEDSDLALVYTSFMNGEIYSAQTLDPDRVQEVKVWDDPADSILIESEQ